MTTISEHLEAGYEKYPYPDKLYPPQLYWGGPFFALAGGYAAYTNIADGQLLTGLGILGFCLMLALICVGIPSMNRGGRSSFRYLNAVVLTRAERAPIDSWVHLAQTRAFNGWLLSGLGLAAIGSAGVFVVAILQLLGVVPKLNEQSTLMSFLVATLLAGALAVVMTLITSLHIARRWRNGRFGARPSGIVLGERSISVRVPGRDAELLWDDVVSVRAYIGANPGRHGSESSRGSKMIPLIEIITLPNIGGRQSMQMLVAHGQTVPTDALYTALRWYHAHPESRWELGRIEGERRLEGWRRIAIGMR